MGATPPYGKGPGPIGPGGTCIYMGAGPPHIDKGPGPQRGRAHGKNTLYRGRGPLEEPTGISRPLRGLEVHISPCGARKGHD